MTLTQSRRSQDEILDYIDQSVRELQEQGLEPRYLVVGPGAYRTLRQAMAERFNRSPGTFESYQWLSIVVDPFRSHEVCVLPNPSALDDDVRTVET
jgi:hypothetical protein